MVKRGKKLASVRRKLLQKRERLVSDIAQELTQSRSHRSSQAADTSDVAASSRDDEIVFQLVEMESAELDEIDDALDRIGQGAYGICEHCGGNISASRLEVLPSTTLCVKCKEMEEQFEGGGSSYDENWENVEEPKDDSDEPRVTGIDFMDRRGTRRAVSL